MIVLYLGRRGCGKTATMVKDAYVEYLRGRRVISNMENINFGEYMSNDEIKAIDKDSDIYNAVLLIDEMQIFFDSRRSMKKGNLDFSYFVQQIRKRKVDILATTQFAGTVEKRVREHTDVVARPNFLEKYTLIEVTYYDETSLQDFERFEPLKRKVVFDPSPVFGLYDTEHIIA